MPLPRFRLRTLMIAVAVVGVAGGIVRATNLFALFLFVGPTIGAFQSGYRSGGRIGVIFRGSFAGALVVSFVLWTGVLALCILSSNSTNPLDELILVFVFLPAFVSLLSPVAIAPIAWFICRDLKETSGSNPTSLAARDNSRH
jgi:hypothetical protein